MRVCPNSTWVPPKTTGFATTNIQLVLVFFAVPKFTQDHTANNANEAGGPITVGKLQYTVYFPNQKPDLYCLPSPKIMVPKMMPEISFKKLVRCCFPHNFHVFTTINQELPQHLPVIAASSISKSFLSSVLTK